MTNNTVTTSNLTDLWARLAVTTDPDEYDQIQAAIKQAEKAEHLATAGQEVTRRQQEADAQAKLEAQHKANIERAQALLDGFEAQDAAIFDALTEAYKKIRDRYDASHAYTQAASDARGTAERLGLPEPGFGPASYTTRGDLGSPLLFARSLIQLYADAVAEFESSARSAQDAGKAVPPSPGLKVIR